MAANISSPANPSQIEDTALPQSSPPARPLTRSSEAAPSLPTVEQSGAASPAGAVSSDPACNAVHSEQAPVPAADTAADRDPADEANSGALQSAGADIAVVL